MSEDKIESESISDSETRRDNRRYKRSHRPVVDVLDGEDVVDVVHGVGGVDQRQHAHGDQLVPPERSQPLQDLVHVHRLLRL